MSVCACTLACECAYGLKSGIYQVSPVGGHYGLFVILGAGFVLRKTSTASINKVASFLCFSYHCSRTE